MKLRSSRWIVPALAAAATGVLAFVIARHMACRAAGPGLDRLQDLSFLRRDLELTEPQVEQIRILHAALAARLRDCCTRHCDARAHLAQALADDMNGSGRTEAVLAELCRAYEASERATLEHIRQVRELLDPKQRERFDRMLTECLCRECPACDARPGPDVTGLPRGDAGNGTKAVTTPPPGTQTHINGEDHVAHQMEVTSAE